MTRSRITSNLESVFESDELFYSKTHKNGVLISGNSVFARVSKYPLADMIGKAHSIVRHPDMPRAVFKYMWDEILAGKPITAYVKNCASDGSYYWVVATVFPDAKGFVSVRLKPTSKILHDTIIPLYAEIKKLEVSTTLDEQVKALLQKINSLGFLSYQDFMQTALTTELEMVFKQLSARSNSSSTQNIDSSRKRTLENLSGLQSSMAKVFEEFNSISNNIDSLDGYFGELSALAKNQALLPFNLTMASQKSSTAQKAIEVLATLFSEQQKAVATFLSEFESIISTAKSNGLAPLRYKTNACYLQISMISQFLTSLYTETVTNEYSVEPSLAVSESLDLISMTVRQFEATLSGLSDMRLQFIRILSKSREMEGIVKTITSIAQLGQIEVSQIGVLGKSILPHLEEMKKFAETLNEKIKVIDTTLKQSSESLDFVSKQILNGTKSCVKAQIVITHDSSKTNEPSVEVA